MCDCFSFEWSFIGTLSANRLKLPLNAPENLLLKKIGIFDKKAVKILAGLGKYILSGQAELEGASRTY